MLIETNTKLADNDHYAKREMLMNPEATATVVHAIVHSQYGDDVYTWDPLTTYLELQADFDCEPDTHVMDRWAAMTVLMLSDAFFKRVDAFMTLCNTFSQGEPAFQIFDPVTVEEAAWALVEVAMNRDVLPFTYGIKHYLKMILRQDGYGDGTYPAVFAEVFKEQPDVQAMRRPGTAAETDQLAQYLSEQLGIMGSQFAKLPSLDEVPGLLKNPDNTISSLTDKLIR